MTTRQFLLFGMICSICLMVGYAWFEVYLGNVEFDLIIIIWTILGTVLVLIGVGMLRLTNQENLDKWRKL